MAADTDRRSSRWPHQDRNGSRSRWASGSGSFRERAELSRPEFAARLGISAKQLGRYEKDLIDPPADVLRSMCIELDISADFLIGLKESSTRVFVQGKSPTLRVIPGGRTDRRTERPPRSLLVQPVPGPKT